MSAPDETLAAPGAPREPQREGRDASWRGARRRWIVGVAALVVAAPYAWSWATYPSDKTPRGAYLRVVTAVNRGRPEQFFAYIEEAAQHACYTIRDYRRQALDHIRSSYPEPQRSEWTTRYQALADAPDGADVFAIYAHERAWLDRLRRDMSGVEGIETAGERATVRTVQGTRYPFRRRPNGIWGSTLFTADLVTEAENAARDLELVERAAADFRRAATRRP